MQTAKKLDKVDRLDKRKLQLSPVKVYVTENYDMFNLSEFNRKSEVSKKLVESIKSNDLTMYNPILVDENGTIVDGQHRFLACMELHLPIHFIISEEIMISDASKINQATRNWSTTDFINHYKARGIANYVKLARLAKQYEMPMTNLLALGKGSTDKNITVTDLAKAGEFEFKVPEARVKEVLDNYQIFKEYHSEFAGTTNFFKAYARVALLEGYNHKQMVTKLKSASGVLHKQPSQLLQIQSILKLYNYGQKNKKLKLNKQREEEA